MSPLSQQRPALLSQQRPALRPALRWQVTNRTGQNLIQFELDPTGSGSFGPPSSTLDNLSTTYATPGLFTATLRATDDQGTVYAAATTVQVLDQTTLDTVLHARWTRVKDALRQGDIAGALGEVYSRSRARYDAIFQAVRPDLPGVDAILTDLQLVEIRGNEAIYAMLRTDGGVIKSFEIRFRKDEDGIWRLWMF